MATNRFSVEESLDAMDVKYFSRVDDHGSAWVVMTEDAPILLCLSENGETFYVQTSSLARLSTLTETQVTQLQTALMHRNRLLATGHYSLHNGVYFECSIALRDAELTQLQVEHLLRVTVAEIRNFQDFLDEFKASPVGDSENTLGDVLTAIKNALKKSEPIEEAEGADTHDAQTPPAMTELSPEASHIHPAGGPETYQVVLTAMDTASKLEVVKLIKRHCQGLSLLQAMKLVESTPTPIGDWASRSEAEVVLQELVECGARAVII